MPIAQRHIDSVMFVCAKNQNGQIEPIGTAFLVSAPSPSGAYRSYFATAYHVVRSGEPTWIRLRPLGDSAKPDDFLLGEWVQHPSADVALIPCDIDTSAHAVHSNLESHFSDKWPHDTPIRLGERAYFVGLLGSVETMKQRAIPMIRSGTIGALCQEDVPYSDGAFKGVHKKAHLLDCYSRSGFSGAPVFVDSLMIDQTLPRGPVISSWVALLGLISGHFLSDGDNAGVAVVTPVEAIRELLEDERLVEWREGKDAELKEQKARREFENAAVVDAATLEPTDFDHFEDLARKLVQVQKKELDEKRKGET